MKKIHLFSLILLFSFGLLTQAYANHQGLKTVRLIGATLPNTPQKITIKQLEAVGTVSRPVFNPYEKVDANYTGVWMADFVKHFGSDQVKTLTATAIDDYQITFTRDEWMQTPILITTQVNGHYIDFAEKGPLRIAFPTLTAGEISFQNNLPKWIWMIKKIELKE